MTQFLYRIYARRLKQFGKQSSHPFDTEQIGMVCPLENQFFGYSG